jgi:hypothetical protein
VNTCKGGLLLYACAELASHCSGLRVKRRSELRKECLLTHVWCVLQSVLGHLCCCAVVLFYLQWWLSFLSRCLLLLLLAERRRRSHSRSRSRSGGRRSSRSPRGDRGSKRQVRAGLGCSGAEQQGFARSLWSAGAAARARLLLSVFCV